MRRWEVEGWQEEDLNKLELSFLTNIFKCNEGEGVDATIAYAKYLYHIGANSDNYPIYLKLIGLRNHWVVDAMIGDKKPETYFSHVQINYFILQECFKTFTDASRGGIYEKTLLVFLGIMQVTYRNALEGYRVYPPSITDINNLGKHLDEEKDQRDPLNMSILTLLDSIASLVAPGRPEEDQDIISLATQANNIRGKFLDMTKNLAEAIPDLLLKTENLQEKEVAPTKS